MKTDELVRINLPLFSTVVPSSMFIFLSCRPFVVITTLSTGLVGVEVTSVSWLGQLEFKSLIIVIVIFFFLNLNSNCQLPKSGDRRNFNTHKTC